MAPSSESRRPSVVHGRAARRAAEGSAVVSSRPKSHPVLRATALGLGVLVGGAMVAVLAIAGFLSNPSLSYACTWPGQHTLAGRSAFVRSHLPDAGQFEVATYDCEDGDEAHLDFVTAETPADARDAFLTDSFCSAPRTPDEPGTILVTCTATKVHLFLSQGQDGDTRGELHLR